MCSGGSMRFKDELLKEFARRAKENMDLLESSFALANVDLIKTKITNPDLIEHHLPVIIEDDPYIFTGKLLYSVVERSEIKVSRTNICCMLILEMVNLILKEFEIERIECIG